jgi:hypothetical protein
MTDDSFTIGFARSPLQTRIDLFFVERGLGVNPFQLVKQRLPSILLLDNMTDAELAAMGLHRDDILPFVFEDCFGGELVFGD